MMPEGSISLWILAVLAGNVAFSEWLSRRGWFAHLGSALLVIVITAVVANLGVIPTYGEGSPVYEGIFRYLAPMAIFWLLLEVNLRDVLQAGPKMIAMFGVGAVGTVLGVVSGMAAVGGQEGFGDLHHALAGMFVGTYTGGSINFNAVALEYGVVREGGLYAGAAVVDSAMTTVWMAATVALPRLLAGVWPGASARSVVAKGAGEEPHGDAESLDPMGMALLLTLGALGVWISDLAAEGLAALGLRIPSILILTTIALVLAQLEPVRRLRGTRLIGWVAVMLFLAVIGALCDLAALSGMGALGVRLSMFVVIVVLVHGLFVFGVAAIFRVDPTVAAVASQANIGGSTSALALARSLRRGDLVLPGVLVGALGNAVGTYLGFLTAAILA
jgi:uncharacterized membrane protein